MRGREWAQACRASRVAASVTVAFWTTRLVTSRAWGRSRKPLECLIQPYTHIGPCSWIHIFEQSVVAIIKMHTREVLDACFAYAALRKALRSAPASAIRICVAACILASKQMRAMLQAQN